MVHLDDSANHSPTCGEVAHTDVSFSVLQIPMVSVRDYLSSYFRNLNPANGIRQYATAGKAIDSPQPPAIDPIGLNDWNGNVGKSQVVFVAR